jgi:mono/diheme cytochrome c family protein
VSVTRGSALGLLATVALLAAAPDGSAPPPLAPMYTTAQARAGKTIFLASCATCHAATLTGGSAPNLFGPAFTASSLTFGGLHQEITTEMPLDNPASLTPEQYADVIAFLLASNCYPAGTTPYPMDDTVPNRHEKVATQGGATTPCTVP